MDILIFLILLVGTITVALVLDLWTYGDEYVDTGYSFSPGEKVRWLGNVYTLQKRIGPVGLSYEYWQTDKGDLIVDRHNGIYTEG